MGTRHDPETGMALILAFLVLVILVAAAWAATFLVDQLRMVLP